MAEATIEHLVRAGRFIEALATAEARLIQTPDDQESLYLAAVAARYAGEESRASALGERLIAAAPDYGRGWQEYGHTLRGAGRSAEALMAYNRALRSNPALKASWGAKAELERASGNAAEAERAISEIAYLSELAPELLSVASMLFEGRVYHAEQLCRHYLQRQPEDVDGMRLLAEIGVRLNVYDDAEVLLAEALARAPDFHLARLDYVGVLHKRQKYALAHEEATRLLAVDPTHQLFRLAFANQSVAIGDHETALTIYDALIAEGNAPPTTSLVKGHALKTIGRQAEAIDAYRATIAAEPSFGDAWWSLANLKTYRFADDDLSAMEGIADAPATAAVDRFHLLFALGKAYEDRSDYARAFAFYDRGNALKRETTRYSAEHMEEELRAQREVVTAELLALKAGSGHSDPAPIFIVGLPRAGSTLVEQILASHSQVDGTLELPNILGLVHRLNGRRRVDEPQRYPTVLAELTPEELAGFGCDYIADTKVYRQGAPRFTDKMPNNFRHIGLIHMILPNATIIDARRDPLDCCFSGFKQLFAEGQEFTYGLEQIGRYYRDYVELMDHWDRVLPGKVLRVNYEETVADLGTQVRRILDHCGLKFEQNCVDFHRTERAVRTASSEQVRQPLYTTGVAHWKHFERWLGPLREILGDLAAPNR